MSGDRITIVVQLPTAADNVTRVLNAVADCWPGVTLGDDGDHGWLITVGGDDRIEPQITAEGDRWWQDTFGMPPIARHRDGTVDWPAFRQQILDGPKDD